MRNLVFLLALIFFGVAALAQPAQPPMLMRQPTVSRTQIAFVFANDIWVVDRNGGDARRLTSGEGTYSDPFFSPDGSLLAFTGRVNGNTEVYVMPSQGGLIRRITYHPGPNRVGGWSPDGKQIVFQSTRNSYTAYPRLFATTLSGDGSPLEFPFPVATEGSYSPDQKRFAYVPVGVRQRSWKNYHGGDTRFIWLIDLSSLDIEKIPHEDANDFNPMWIGNTVYFLSDRKGRTALFAYDTQTKKIRQVLENHGLDIKCASTGPDAIAYEQFGSVHLFDLAGGKEHRVVIQIHADLPALRPHMEKIGSREIHNFAISPTGARAAFEAHGEIFTVPAEKGDARDITNTPGVAERTPAWSPDGKWIAYFSDASGEYELEIRNQDGTGTPRHINLGKPGGLYFHPVWSPDSRKIAYVDHRSIVWCVDVEKGGPPLRIDTNQFSDLEMEPSWSPDSKWLAYIKHMPNHFHSVFFYSFEQGKSFRITDEMVDVHNPVFDKNGKYLYFTASSDVGLAVGLNAGLDMSGLDHPISSNVYMMLLDKTLPSPFPIESDEEKVARNRPENPAEDANPSEAVKPAAPLADKPAARDKSVAVKIDLENIAQRIIPLPIPAHNYDKLLTGKEGVLFLTELPPLSSYGGARTAGLYRFTVPKKKLEKLLDNVTSFVVSANGDKMLIHLGQNWSIVSASDPIKPGEGVLKTSELAMSIDPRAEWAQVYQETWRFERDFFYAPNFQGLDIADAERKYAVYLPGLSSREDLTYLCEEMLGNLSVGHSSFSNPPGPDREGPHTGLLGADYRIENGRYRFTRIYTTERWNPDARAPLGQVGTGVAAGEYLLAVNGHDLHAADNIYEFFEGTGGKVTSIKVGPDPDGKGAREFNVVPIENEILLRGLGWVEDNRRAVDKLSGSRLAYIYMANTTAIGYNSFNRYYFSQTDRQGAILDDRFNIGGLLSDYVVDYLGRTRLNCVARREGDDICNPAAGIFGPKVMLINEESGSGGDALPWYFHKRGIGPLVGKRTWGGLVGLRAIPEFIDGGSVSVPNQAVYNLTGDWEVENHGVPPDVEVELDPKAARDGHDSQLERAVKIALDEIAKHPAPKYRRPPYPDYHQQILGTPESK